MSEKESDAEQKPLKDYKKFPIAVILIILNEFCERFSYSGMRAFLSIYLKQKLFYTDDEATEVYHIFTTMAYFFPVFGAIIADSYLGKFRTILYLMFVYAIGNILLAVTAIPYLEIPGREFTMLGLLLVALGTGGIKPCVSAFGGDQFKLPEQEQMLTAFFSMFYFIICIGSLVAKSISPLLRSEIHCFGDKDCYSVAFGAPGILIVASIIMYVCGKSLYIIKKPKGNIVLDVSKCICNAIKNRRSSKNNEKKVVHWLDNAKEKFDQSFIDEVKKTLGVFLLFTPLPIFWALLDQMGSRWTLQATKMEGTFWFFTVKPDQMQVTCPIMILILIPLFRNVIYPMLAKHGILCKLLHRIIAGCILAAIAFIFSGFLNIEIEKTMPILPSKGLGQLRIFNGYNNCDLAFNNTITGETFKVPPLEMYENKFIGLLGSQKITYNTSLLCKDYQINRLEKIILEENKAISIFFKNNKIDFEYIRYEDHIAKSRSGYPYMRILGNIHNMTNLTVRMHHIRMDKIEIETDLSEIEKTEVFSGVYQLKVNTQIIPIDLNLKIGGVYTIILAGSEENDFNAQLITITEPNSLSMAWIIPQIFTISIAEVLFAISGLEFAFKEAPESMKSVLQAYWLLIEAFGNVIIILVTRFGSGYRQSMQFFFFACLMFIATIVFYMLTRRHERKRGDMATGCDVIKYTEVMQKDDIGGH